MVPDSRDGSILLFGGFDIFHSQGLNDTWRFAGGAWKNISGSVGTAPSPRGGALGSDDRIDGYDLLFGGYSDNGYSNVRALHNDTWSFEGGHWHSLQPLAGIAPPPRYGGSAMYDSNQSAVVVYGGSNVTNSYLKDGWKFSGGAWSPLGNSVPYLQSAGAGIASPGVFDERDGCGLYFDNSGAVWTRVGSNWSQAPADPYGGFGLAGAAYDALDGYVVSFGGTDYWNGYSNTTWTFSAGVWTPLQPNPSPSAREGPALSYDPDSRQIVLFGGMSTSGTLLNDTWSYRQGRWSLFAYDTLAPSPRRNAFMTTFAYGYTFLFGGIGASQQPLNDSWLFHHGVWTQVGNASSAAPPAVSYPSLALESSLGQVLFYGSTDSSSRWGVSNQTWEYYDGWTRLFPAHDPGAMYGAAMSDDSRDGYVLLGSWAFVQGDWVQLSTFNPLDSATFANMVDDTGDGFVLLFNGDIGCGCPDSWTMKWSTYDSTPGTTAQPLTVTVSASPLSGSAPLSVTFSALVSGAESPYGFLWSYGDYLGGPGLLQNVTYTFTKPGLWVNLLVVTDALGDQLSRVVNVSVSPTPPLLLSASAAPSRGAAPLPVGFWLNGSGGVPPYSVNWSFGDGFGGVGGAVSHTYRYAGEYVAEATVTDRIGESDLVTLYVTVTAPLTALILAGPSVGVIPLAVNFTAFIAGGAPPYQLAWGFGDGTSSGAASPTHTYDSSGVYSVLLYVTDSFGTATLAVSTIHAESASGPESLSVAISATPSTGTAPLLVSLSGTAQGGVPPYNYTWIFSGGGTGSSPTVTYRFPDPGTFQVVLLVRDSAGASAAGSASIVVAPPIGGVSPGWGIDVLSLGAPGGLALGFAAGACVGVVALLIDRRRRGAGKP